MALFLPLYLFAEFCPRPWQNPDFMHQIYQSMIHIYMFTYVHTKENHRTHKARVVTAEKWGCPAALSPAEVALCKQAGGSDTIWS